MPVPRIDVGNLILLGLVSASIHWLLARSAIFEFFWGRVRGFVEKLLACAACSGFWIGIGLGLGGVRPVQDVAWWAQIAGAGFLGIWLTPVFEGALMWGLRESHIIVPVDSERYAAFADLPSVIPPPPTGFQSTPPPPPQSQRSVAPAPLQGSDATQEPRQE